MNPALIIDPDEIFILFLAAHSDEEANEEEQFMLLLLLGGAFTFCDLRHGFFAVGTRRYCFVGRPFLAFSDAWLFLFEGKVFGIIIETLTVFALMHLHA